MLSEAKHLRSVSGVGLFKIDPRFFASLRMTIGYGLPL
jgi:hypothetical protein